MSILTALAVAASTASLQPVSVACPKPTAPDFAANVVNRDVSDFNSLTRRLSRYDDEMNAYRTCLDGIMAAGDSRVLAALEAYNESTPEQEAIHKKYDQAATRFEDARKQRAASAAAAATKESEAALAEAVSSMQR